MHLAVDLGKSLGSTRFRWYFDGRSGYTRCMTVSDDQLGLADSSGDLTVRPGAASRPAGIRSDPAGARPRPRRPLPSPAPTGPGDLPRYLRAAALLADADELDTAYAACDVAIEAAAEWGAPAALAAVHSLRGALSRRLGNLPAAERDGRTAARLLSAAGADPRGDAATLLTARRIAVLVDMGDIEDADALLAGVGVDEPRGGGALGFQYVRGRLHAAAGRSGEALADFFQCGERLAARQADRPTILSWRSSAAAILAEIGTRESATRLVEAEVALCRQAGTASAMSRPSALGRALRVRGRVLGGAAGIASLEEAIRVLRASPRRFEYAQALVDCGELLNEARRRPQARRVLREGLDLAAQCGSPALVARARAAHVAAGGKPRQAGPVD
jgi:tetratricopeptide (TPR) repeat protein